MTRSASRAHRAVLILSLGLVPTCASKESQHHDAPVSSLSAEIKTVTDDNSRQAPTITPCPAALIDSRRGGSSPERYMTPSEAERDAFAELAALLLSPTFERAAADDKARLLGFGLEEVPEIPGTVLLRERPTRRRGGGAYLIRLHAKSATIIQAPHTFFDEGTLPLACEMFQRSAAAALFIDTAHRYKAAPPDEDGGYPADVAHARDSFFQAATAGALNANSERTVVQLHGFVPRESGAAVVLSSGLAQPDAPLPTRVRDRLQTLLPELVARFPDETQELGATGNAQGVLVRNAGGQFLHVEMSASLRRVLLAQPDLRARFLDSLAACLEHP